MERRRFLTSAVGAAGMALGAAAPEDAQQAGGAREYYELRQYKMESGPQQKLTDAYVAEALIPALNKMGISPVGAFLLDIGPETPMLYLLLPSQSVETLVTSDLHLAQDEAFLKAAAPFWSAPRKSLPLGARRVP